MSEQNYTLAGLVEALTGQTSHLDHPWHQVGRCVWCGPCRVRLYQGTLPDDHPVYKPPWKPSEADKMRERWGK